ncbi:hypothetical protein AbraIFM66951_011275 [Aspergillus brasiliensis]|uniref:Cystathionine beta-lyase n=1 Tax=Aspergillus brasiliensis TaxID=319629 RepID=A0A9W5YLL4_9EURO|nr:hypothetical protein AbraCBS73388_004368 [Aspergillus brasiliensis]GKZ47711.1 hypothetical protein AbraIFM66951_011275 [Aspergillus brasiliensis]
MATTTKAIHADDTFTPHRAIAPAMHVAVTYRYTRDSKSLIPNDNTDPYAPQDSHIYARYSTPNTSRFETVLSQLFNSSSSSSSGVLTYSTGLAAFHAIMVHLNPTRIFIGEEGYHGIHAIIDIMSKLTGLQKHTLDELHLLGEKDIIHIETPVNPTGEARNLAYYSEIARYKGAYLTVDATLAPPPLQDPLLFGADIVMHSGTKYIGGHSDMMCGVVVVRENRVKEGWMEKMARERLVLGAVMGNLEGWLGLRSLRTLDIRVKRQSATARELVRWLVGEIEMAEMGSVVGRVVERVKHASLQEDDGNGWLRRQMSGGFGAVFAIWVKSEELARRLPGKMLVFQHATSLGDVESLIEWRAMSDSTCDRRLLRVSCGLEDVEDLKTDFMQACQALL